MDVPDDTNIAEGVNSANSVHGDHVCEQTTTIRFVYIYLPF